MTFIDDEAELLREHQAQKAAREAAREAEEEAAREARRKAEAQKRWDRERPIWDGIARHLSEGTRVRDPETGQITWDGVKLVWLVDIQEVHAGAKWWPTGKLKVTVGEYGNRTTYPQRKDGTFAYDKMAIKLAEIVSRRRRQEKARSQGAINSQVVKELKESLGLESYGSEFQYTDDPARPVQVEFKRSMSVDQAKAVYKALRALGIQIGYPKKKEG